MEDVLNTLIFATGCSLMTIASGIFVEKTNRTEMIIIFALLFLWGADSLFILSEETFFYRYYPHLLYLNQPFELFLGPLVYFRFRLMIEGKMRFDRLAALLLVPGVLAVAYFIPFFIQSPDAKLASVGFDNIQKGATRGTYLFIMYSAGPYFIACLVLGVVHGYRTLSKRGIRLLMQKKYFVSYNVLWISLLFIIYIAILSDKSLMLRWTILLITTLLILSYYLEKKHVEFFLEMQKDASETRYAKSMLGGIDTGAVIERLKELMELEKIYLDEGLSLQGLSSRLGITPHQLSEILNGRLSTNFRSFVNTYRIHAAKKLLMEDENISIMRAAYRCGFNSKTVFNNAFLKTEGITPTEFKERNRKERSDL
ncbi:MAG: AraC family transcriptional regulator [Spirochaetes bacterium]|nr:MAG: AraC family transcriptional regulator [Spirochaetota bacterium]